MSPHNKRYNNIAQRTLAHNHIYHLWFNTSFVWGGGVKVQIRVLLQVKPYHVLYCLQVEEMLVRRKKTVSQSVDHYTMCDVYCDLL